LDYPTSGLMIFALSKKIAAHFSSCFASRKISKMYLALVEAPSDHKLFDQEKYVLIQYPLKAVDQGGYKQQITRMDDPEGKEAITRAKRLAKGKICKKHINPECESNEFLNVWLMGLFPVTGRTHQLRVHLSALGIPIVGDETYGEYTSTGIVPNRLMLHAYSLNFPLPGNMDEIEICTPKNPFLEIMQDVDFDVPIEKISFASNKSKMWNRWRYASIIPIIFCNDQIYLVLCELPKKRKDFSKKKGFWWGLFWKELESSDCDIAEGAAVAFHTNTMNFFKNSNISPCKIRMGANQSVIVVPNDSGSKQLKEYPDLLVKSSALIIAPLFTKVMELDALKEAVDSVNALIVENASKKNKDASRIAKVSARKIGIFALDEVVLAASSHTGLILDSFLEEHLKCQDIIEKISSFKPIEPYNLPSEIVLLD
jgi:hypothetical protein